MLSRISVGGEVSNCKYHSSGHIYFSLKDGSGSLACVMFAGQRKGLAFAMKNGDRVVVTGSVDVYERDGKYQMYARKITLEGAGILYERFLALKEELEDMECSHPSTNSRSFIYQNAGCSDGTNRCGYSGYPKCNSPRNPYVQIILYPARVQGEDAAESIVEGIEALDQLGVDVIIVGRGGGSMEDLWAFNEEIVARAIFNCTTPIISAVGHETDVTIADYVADLRAPTPSAAAELAVFDYRGWQEVLAGYVRRLELSMDSKLEMTRQRLTEKAARLAYLSPENQIREKRMYLLRAEEKLTERMEKKLQMEKTRLYLYAERLRGVSPLEKLQQGLGYMEHEDGTRISSVNQVTVGERMKTYVKDGVIWSNVEKTEHSEEWNASRDKEPDNCE